MIKMIDITIEYHRYSPSFLIPIFFHLFGISQAAPRRLRPQGPQVSQQELRHVQRGHRRNWRCVTQTWRSGTSPVGPKKMEELDLWSWRNAWILLGKSDMKYERYRTIVIKAWFNHVNIEQELMLSSHMNLTNGDMIGKIYRSLGLAEVTMVGAWHVHGFWMARSWKCSAPRWLGLKETSLWGLKH